MSGLDWPAGFDRTPESERRRYHGGFEVDRRTAFDSILEELEKMDAVNVEVKTAAPHTTKKPHQPYKDRDPDDPGVVVYFDRDGQRFAVPCDRWNNLRDNARAIAKYLDAKRAIERYGVATVETEMSTQALPSGDDDVIVAGGEKKEPHEVLQIQPDAPEDVVKAAARARQAETHPDNGGDREEFRRVNEAKEAMLDE
ncbi:J domain-containing protein [Halorubrum tebenquichense]|uniref:Dnaj-like protein n=1 Tax=Halorubrum tebenquichense DSM 14210 TaxID=1227485 RepID=M0DWC6_9EURY|nr:J domain-containing protein [Halorubrum tebenquichense]ELZ38992.1 dnaj-like protein [Halorubrum tebenquichense DSM 14210]